MIIIGEKINGSIPAVADAIVIAPCFLQYTLPKFRAYALRAVQCAMNGRNGCARLSGQILDGHAILHIFTSPPMFSPQI